MPYIIGGILVLYTGFVLFRLIKNAKKGKFCSGCSGCSSAGNCSEYKKSSGKEFSNH
jgi:attachment p12 family protein